MRVNNLSKVALGSAADGIEPAISSRKSNAITTTPPSHTWPNKYTPETGGNDDNLNADINAIIMYNYYYCTVMV